MKGFKEAKSRQILLLIFTLALFFTSIFALASLQKEEDAAYAADSHPTATQLSQIGYSIKTSAYRIIGNSTGTTLRFNSGTKTVYGTEYINVLSKGNIHYLFFTAVNDTPKAWALSPGGGANPYYDYLNLSSSIANFWNATNVTFSTPQSVNDLYVDSAGRIYFLYSDHNGVSNKKYYLGTSGFTESTSGVPTVVKKVTAPTGGTFTYNGSLQQGVASGTGYTLGGTYAATNVGTYYASATLQSGYVWSDGSSSAKIISWKINALSLTQASVNIAAGDAPYSPDGAIPSYVYIAYGNKLLTEGTDYTLTYFNNTGEAGTQGAIGVTFKGNYTGTAIASYNIVKSDCRITAPDAVKVSALGGESALEVSTNSTGAITYALSDSDNGIVSVSGSGSSATLTGGAKLGTATVKVSVEETDGYYAGEKIVTVQNLLDNGFYIVKDGEKYAYADINEAYAALGDAAEKTIYVVGNPTVSAPLVIGGGEKVIVAAGDSSASITGANNATLSRAEGFTGSIFSVEGGGALTMEGVTLDGENKSGPSLIISAGTLTLGDGVTVKNGNSENGGAVNVSGGSLNITDGTIFTGNTAVNGGAVYVADGGQITVGDGATLTGNTAENGGAIYIAGGAALTVEEGSSFTANRASANGGAIYIETGATAAVEGGTIKNNSAGGTGGGIYIEDKVQLSLAGAATGVTDGIGIAGAGQIVLTGLEVTGDFTVDFADPANQIGETVEGNPYLLDYAKSTAYVVAENDGISNSVLNSHFSVQNNGYVFDYDKTSGTEEYEPVEGLCLKKSIVNVVAYDDPVNGLTYFSSIKEAIAHVKEYGVKDENGDSTGTLYFLQHETVNGDGSKSYSHVTISLPMTIPDGVNLTYESAVMVPERDEDGNVKTDEYGQVKEEIVLPNEDGKLVDADGNPYSPTVIKRAVSLTEALLTVQEGGTLTIGNVTFDGGAVWGEDGTEGIQIIDDGKGGAGTVTTNNTGITAHAPVIVNRGTLTIADGATVQNNENNYAAPGEGFGSQNYGGGIRNEGSGELIVTGGAIRDCYSREGGAIMNVNKPETAAYVEGGNPSVTISGGEITGNVSQQKGAAVQTIYGGATTTVSGEAVIEGNWSLNDLGVLSVEEGGALTVSGGTVSTASATDKNGDPVENDNAIYLYNKYSAEDYANASAKPFIEGDGAGELHITGAPELTGSVHIDGACTVVGSDTYYEPYVDMTGYTGGTLSVDLTDGAAYGKVAENVTGDFTKLSINNSVSEGLNALFTYRVQETDENGNDVYALYTSGYRLEIGQTQPGVLTVTGVCDPAIESFTLTIDGKSYVISKENGAILEDGEILYDLDLNGVDGTDFTADISVAIGGKTVYDTTDGVPLKAVKFDPRSGKIFAPEDSLYLNSDGDKKLLTTGVLPNDMAIDQDGNITVFVDEEERVIQIGQRAEEIDEDVVTALYDINDTTIHVRVGEQFRDYEYNLVYTDENGSEIVYENWLTPDSENGDIVFEGLQPGWEYTVVVRNPAETDEADKIIRIPGVYQECVDSTYETSVFRTLTTDQIQDKKVFEDAYAGIEGSLLVKTDDGQVTAEPEASAKAIKEVIDLYDALIDDAKSIPAIHIKIARLKESYDHALANEWVKNNADVIETVLGKDYNGDGEVAKIDDPDGYQAALDKALTEYEADDFTDGARELVKDEYDSLVGAYKDVIIAELKAYIDTAVDKGANKNEVTAMINGYIEEINAADRKADIYQLAERAKLAADLRAEYDAVLARNDKYSAEESVGMTEDSLTQLEAAFNSGLNAIHEIEASDTLTTGELLEIVYNNAVVSMRNIEAQGVVESYYASIVESYDKNGIISEEAKAAIEEVKNAIVGEDGKIQNTSGVDGFSADEIVGRISSYLLELDKAEGKAILHDYLDYGDENSEGDAQNILALVTGENAADDQIDGVTIPAGELSAKEDIANIVERTKLAIDKERAKDEVETEYDKIAERINGLGGDKDDLAKVTAILNEFAGNDGVIDGTKTAADARLEAARAIALMQIEGERAAIETELKKLNDLNAGEKMNGKTDDETDGGVNGILDGALSELKADAEPALTAEDFARIKDKAVDAAADYLEAFDRAKYTEDHAGILAKAEEIVKEDGSYGAFGEGDGLHAIIADVDGALTDLADNYLASSQEKMDDLRDLLLGLKKAALIAQLKEEFNEADSVPLNEYIGAINDVDIAGGKDDGATAAADAAANEELNLLALQAAAAADYLDSYTVLNGVPANTADEAVSQVLDNIGNAQDVEGINTALKNGVLALIDSALSLDGDSAETDKIISDGKVSVESAVDSANEAAKVADLSTVVATIKADVEEQRAGEKQAAKDLIDGDEEIAAIKAALSAEAKTEAEELIDAAKSAIDEDEYDGYPAIIAKLKTKLAVLKTHDAILTENGNKISDDSKGDLRTILDAAYAEIEGAEEKENISLTDVLDGIAADAELGMNKIKAAELLEDYYNRILVNYEKLGISSPDTDDLTALYEAAVAHIGQAESIGALDETVEEEKLLLDKEEAITVLQNYVKDDTEEIKALIGTEADGETSASGPVAEILAAETKEDVDRTVANTQLEVEKSRAKDAVKVALADYSPAATVVSEAEEYIGQGGIIDGQTTVNGVWAKANRMIAVITIDDTREALYKEIESDATDKNAADKKAAVDAILDGAVASIEGMAVIGADGEPNERFTEILATAEKAIVAAEERLDGYDRNKYEAEHAEILGKALADIKADDLAMIDGALDDLAENYIIPSQNDMDDLRNDLLTKKKAALTAALESEKSEDQAVNSVLDGYIAGINGQPVDGDREADGIVNENLDLLRLKAIAAKDYLESYRKIYDREADLNDKAVNEALDGINAATDLAAVNEALGVSVKVLLDGILLEGDSANTKAAVENVKSAVDNTVDAAVDTVADLSEAVNTIRSQVTAQRRAEETEAIAAIVAAYEEAKTEIADDFQAYAEAIIEEAKKAITEGEYSGYDLIKKKTFAKIAIVKHASELLEKAEDNNVTAVDALKNVNGLCDDIERATDPVGVEEAAQNGALVLEKRYATAYLNSLVGEEESDFVKAVVAGSNGALSAVETAQSKAEIDTIVANAEVALAGERYLDENSVLRKNFMDINGSDLSDLEAAEQAFGALSDRVKEYLDGDNRGGYDTFNGLIGDALNKAEFENRKADVLTKTKQLLPEQAEQLVRDAHAAQVAKIQDINYEPCNPDGDRVAYAQAKSDELDAAFGSAMTEMEFAQEQQRAIDQALRQMQDLLENKEYEYSREQAEYLQEIVDRFTDNVKDVTTSSEDWQNAIDELLNEAKEKLDDAPVTSVVKGDLVPSDGSADYGEDHDGNEIWGIVTNESGIEGSVVLVIEKVEEEREEQIRSALMNGNLISAEGSDIAEEELSTLVQDKEVKSTIDIYLLKNNAKITEFDGVYLVKILLDNEMRSMSGLQVVYFDDNGNVQVYRTSIEDGKYLVFTTTHFSEFFILGEPELNLWWLIITLSVLFVIELIAIAVVWIKRKKQDGQTEKTCAFMPLASLLTVIIPNGAVVACILLGTCIVVAGAALAVLALKKPSQKKTTSENEPEETVEAQADEGIRAEVAVAAGMAVAVTGEEEETETVYDSVTHRYIIIRYSRSFLAKLIQSDDETKSYYEELKNEIMSYGVKSRISWRYESFRHAKKLLIKMQMRGKTLCLCFALSASDYAESKYKVEDYSEVKVLEDTPCLYRIKNARRCRYAKDLIADVMKKYGLERGEEQTLSYAYELPYEETAALVSKGLIKVLTDEEAQSGTQFRPVEVRHEVKATEVDEIISDAEAKALIVSSARYADKTKTGIINVDTISLYFQEGETVTLEEIKRRVPGFTKKITYIKVLARGTLDKSLTVEADDFSIEAVKMILLTGGKVVRTLTK